ncbi:DUF2339 domain-containing protein [Schaalia suimastitidis]|uniref:DUF2339 domain-containing protein n=1 Tax=Schaalia suimastitidis TaxID=121163 RepID=UPI00042A6F92|nr:DUF2339 domain-containing protein [Schaalia suimastitidis]
MENPHSGQTPDNSSQDTRAIRDTLGALSAQLNGLSARIDALERQVAVQYQRPPVYHGPQIARPPHAPAPHPPFYTLPTGPNTPATVPVTPSTAPTASAMETASPSAPVSAPLANPHQPSSPRREYELGAHLLSIAAAVLILLAGASLVALLWTSLSDAMRIIMLTVASVIVTGSGSLWSVKTTRYRPAAATLTGIGVGLGFVTFVGAALLNVLTLVGSFALLTVWTCIAIAISLWTRLAILGPLTALGGIVTVTLVSQMTWNTRSIPLNGTLLILAYVTLLLALTAVSTLWMPKRTWRPLYFASSTAVSAYALLFAPFDQWQTLLGILAHCALFVVFVANLLVLVHPSTNTGIAEGKLELAWFLHPFGMGAVLFVVSSSKDSFNTYALVTCALLCGLIVLSSGAVLSPRIATASSCRWATYALTASAILIFLWSLSATISNVHTGITGLFLIALVAAVVPAIRAKSCAPALITPLVVLLLPTPSHSAASYVIAVAALLIAFAVSLTASVVSSYERALNWSTWILVLLLMVKVPLVVYVILTQAVASPAWPVWAVLAAFTLSTLSLTTVTFLGFGSGPATPSQLFAGAHCLKRAQVVPVLVRGQFVNKATSQHTVILLTGIVLLLIFTRIFSVFSGFYAVPWSDGSANLWNSQPVGILATVVLVPIVATALWLARPLIHLRTYAFLLCFIVTIATFYATVWLFDVWPWSLLVTVILLALGASAIVIGFWHRLRNIRLYGLILVMLIVLKLAFIDLGGYGTGSYIASLLLAGAMCYGLSVIYGRLSALEQQDLQREAKQKAQDTAQQPHAPQMVWPAPDAVFGAYHTPQPAPPASPQPTPQPAPPAAPHTQ